MFQCETKRPQRVTEWWIRLFSFALIVRNGFHGQAGITPPRNDAERARVLATINGETITSGDVEDSLKAVIFDVQERVYKLRKDELELSVNDALLVQEAQKRKITTNALLDAEVKPKAVTEDQALVFFEQNKDRVSGNFAQIRDSIIRYLEQIEVRVAERAFVDKLRAAASIQIFLVAPESPIFFHLDSGPAFAR